MALNTGAPVRTAIASSTDPSWHDGDSAPLRVNPVTGALKTEVTGAGSGGTSATDGDAFTAGSSAGTPLMGENGTSLKIALVNAVRALVIQLANSSGTEIGTLGAPIRNTTVGSSDVRVGDGAGNYATITGGKLDVNATVSAGANQTVDLNKIAGTAVDANSGSKSAGTLRVVIATDQPALTNKLLVTPDLPSGASTAAKQPALGIAGTASADVITVQGIASMTALKVDASATTQPVSGTVTANIGTSGSLALDATLSTLNTKVATAITADYDTGAGTQTIQMLGIALPASGGSVAGGTATNPIQVSLANTAANATAVKVDGSAVTQPVSGTVTTTPPANASTNVAQINGVTPLMGNGVTGTGSPRVTIASDNTAFSVNAVQSGTWTVQPGNTANTTAWKVDGSAVTQPVSGTVTANIGTVGTLATAAKQDTGNTSVASIDTKTPALGQALAAASVPIVLTAAQITTLTPPAAITNFANETGGNLATVAAAVVSQEATTSGVKGITAFGAVTTNAPTYTTAKSDALSLDTSGLLRVSLKDTPANTNKLLVTPDSVALPANQSVNVSQINGVTTLMGNGVTGTGSQRVTIASDNTAFSVNSVQSGTWTVQPGNTANTTPWLTSAQAATAGGCSISRTLSAANTTGINAKGSAGQVYGWVITNTNASARFVKLYNKATLPTVGTDTPVITLAIPGNATGTGMVAADFSTGIAFATGIGYGITTGVADNDTGAPAANEVIVNLFYK